MSDHPTAVSNPDDAGLAERLATVQRRIASACESAGRSPGSVTLVAVTKYAEPGQVSALVRLGVTDLGENYVQNLQKRTEAVGPPSDSLRWHFVGHLQRNKVKQVLPHVTMLQTLDSLRLAEELESQVPRVLGPTARLPVLMQVNCSEEPQKSGVAVGAARHLGSEIASMKHLRLMGLMTMAKEGDDEAGTRRTFTRCREIFEEMRRHGVAGEDLRHLSMGMTTDLEHGIAEGATIVRVGSALFKNPEA